MYLYVDHVTTFGLDGSLSVAVTQISLNLSSLSVYCSLFI